METLCGNHFVNTLTTLTALLINIWILLAPSGASRYLHMVLSSNTAVAADLQCDLGADVPEGQGQPSAGGVGQAAGDTGSGGHRGSGCSHQGRETIGQPERKTGFLMQRSTGQGGACLLPFLSKLVLV